MFSRHKRSVLLSLALTTCSSESSPAADSGTSAEENSESETDAVDGDPASGEGAEPSNLAADDDGAEPSDGDTPSPDDDDDSDSPSDEPDLCGNGELDGSEQCDDGNDVNADGCNRDCRESAQPVAEFSFVPQTDGFSPDIGEFARLSSLTALNDGDVTLSVRTGLEDREPLWLDVRYTGDGELQWSMLHNFLAPWDTQIEPVAVWDHVYDESGMGSFVYGRAYRDDAEFGPTVVGWLGRYSATGELEVVTAEEPGYSNYGSVAVLQNGDFLLAVYDYDGHSIRQISPSGELQWESRGFDDPENPGRWYGGLMVTDSGSIYLLRDRTEPGGDASLRFSSDGQLEQLTPLAEQGATSSYLLLRGVVLGEDHVSCVVSTFVDDEDNPSEQRSETHLLRVGPDGNRIWQRDLSDIECADIARDEDENLVVIGNSENSPSRASLHKLDSAGETLWEVSLDDPVSRVDVHGNGDISVAGVRDDAREVWVSTYTP